MKTHKFLKFAAILLTLSALLITLASCKDKKGDSENDLKKDILDISEYTVVRKDASDTRVTEKTSNLRRR